MTALEELKSALDDDPRLVSIKKAEALCMESEEVLALSKAKDAAQEAYSSLIGKRPSGDEELLMAEKNLFESKLALDTHPLVKDYSEKYSIVRDLYMQIDDMLFSSFRGKRLFEDDK